jgi:hypothetical protein
MNLKSSCYNISNTNIWNFRVVLTVFETTFEFQPKLEGL